MVMASPNAIPDDLLINAADEIRIRQDLVLTALGRRPADRALRIGRLRSTTRSGDVVWICRTVQASFRLFQLSFPRISEKTRSAIRSTICCCKITTISK